MKKIIIALLVISLLVGCSSNAQSASSSSAPENSASVSVSSQDTVTQQISSGGGVSIDEKLFDVEITLPASFVGENTTEELTEENKANGFKSAKLNPDGSITYTISKSDYDKLMKEFKKTTQDYLEKIPNEYDSIIEAKLNDKMTEATLIVKREEFEKSLDRLAVLGVYLQVAFYQAFDGVPKENIKLTINIQDSETSEIFETIVYPDALKK